MMLMARLGLVLLAGGWLVSAPAQDEPSHIKPTDNDSAIPTRVTPIKAQKPKDATPRALKPSRPKTAPVQRVTVRHQYDTPRNIMLRSDLHTFYLPHTTIPTIDPTSAAWALEGAYLARSEHDRKQLLRLYRFRDANERQHRLTSKHEQAVAAGVAQLKTGDYPAAIASLSLAGELDKSDPIARIHLAQARLALGQYEDAATALRRALELQPKLIYLDLRLWTYYRQPAELTQYVAAFEKWLQSNPATAEAYFMFGYLSYQIGQRADARDALQRVADARPRDTLARELLSIAKPGRE